LWSNGAVGEGAQMLEKSEFVDAKHEERKEKKERSRGGGRVEIRRRGGGGGCRREGRKDYLVLRSLTSIGKDGGDATFR